MGKVTGRVVGVGRGGGAIKSRRSKVLLEPSLEITSKHRHRWAMERGGVLGPHYLNLPGREGEGLGWAPGRVFTRDTPTLNACVRQDGNVKVTDILKTHCSAGHQYL